MNQGDEVEQVAARIEALSDRLPLARPAAMLLRGQWMQAHGEVSKAERQIIEASALLPANPPDYLRLRLLMSSAYVKNRGGHYDEAMLRYNQALKLVDETGPIWRRIDLRALIARVLLDAGQTDKAAEINREQMRLATESADEYGISAAYTHPRHPVQPRQRRRHACWPTGAPRWSTRAWAATSTRSPSAWPTSPTTTSCTATSRPPTTCRRRRCRWRSRPTTCRRRAWPSPTPAWR